MEFWRGFCGKRAIRATAHAAKMPERLVKAIVHPSSLIAADGSTAAAHQGSGIPGVATIPAIRKIS